MKVHKCIISTKLKPDLSNRTKLNPASCCCPRRAVGRGIEAQRQRRSSRADAERRTHTRQPARTHTIHHACGYRGHNPARV